ncbi:MAG TPA: hypothetical protein VEF04_02940, partial [Blastocatellia bacterium]|nr:hypothetical protein [Blastocatellia bacterium]
MHYDPQTVNPIYHFLFGLRFFFAGIGMLFRHPSLLGLGIVPIILTFFVVLGLALLLAWFVGSMIEGTFPNSARIAVQAI